MRIDLLHHFAMISTYCLDTYLREEQLGILSRGILPGAPPYTFLTSLAVVDVLQRKWQYSITYDGHGPETEATWTALLRYDSSQKRWVIGSLQGLSYSALRTVIVGTDGSLTPSPLCLLDNNESHDEGFHPLLDLEITEQAYRLFYHKPSQEEHRTAAVVIKQDIALYQPGWNALADHAAVIQSSDNGKGISELITWQEWQTALKQQSPGSKKTLLPVQTSLDPGRFNARQAAEIEIASQTDVAEAESAMTIADQQTRLLVLCCPETWVWPNEGSRSDAEIEQTGEQWRIWLTGWERSAMTSKWTYSPDIGLPTDPSVPDYEHPKLPTVEVAAIPGPATIGKQPTFVATMAMQGADELLSHGVCLTSEGEVVQVCRAALGRAPSLCLCQQTIVGVDRLAGGWRLWNWLVLDESTLRITLALDATCRRASVRAQPNAERFWLIEELPAGVRVSQRDAQTLAEVTPAELIPETQLLAEQADRPLEPQRNVGLLPYQDTLLLLLAGKQEELLLYQAQ